MQLRPNFHHPSSNRAIDSLPRPEGPSQSTLPPKDDGVFTIDDIICPFQRVAYNEGALKVDSEGNTSNLPEVLKKYAGASSFMTAVAHHAAKKLTAGNDWNAFWADSYNLQDLEGGSLDHDADTQILRGGFHQERLDRALSFSSDGQRLTFADLRRFQNANLEEEPGQRGKIFGAAELALLVKVFGRTDGEGTRFMRNDDFVRIFKDNKWPEDWQPPAPGSLNVFSTALAVREYFAADSDGAIAEAATLNQGPQKLSGGCPFIQGQAFDIGEAAKHHSDKLA